MKLKVNRHGFNIYAENETEEAYIEEVLGLRKDGDFIRLVRKNDFALKTILTHLQTEKEPHSA